MFTHSDIWDAIDKIAERNEMSVSALSRRAGLDATSFNKSKRITGGGRPRWPSTESIAKVLECTNTSIAEFTMLLQRDGDGAGPSFNIPLIKASQAGDPERFDDAGFPTGSHWRQYPFPRLRDRHAYALEVDNDNFLPDYRRGDTVILSPDSPLSRGDRVVVRTHLGSTKAWILSALNTTSVELADPAHPNEAQSFDSHDIDWMAKIVWASQ